MSVQRPPAALWGPMLRTFVRQVTAARTTGTLTSWWRSPADNARVGGSPNSLHLYGLAIDVVPAPGQWVSDEAAWKAAGLRVLREGDHLHISLPVRLS